MRDHTFLSMPVNGLSHLVIPSWRILIVKLRWNSRRLINLSTTYLKFLQTIDFHLCWTFLLYCILERTLTVYTLWLNNLVIYCRWIWVHCQLNFLEKARTWFLKHAKYLCMSHKFYFKSAQSVVIIVDQNNECETKTLLPFFLVKPSLNINTSIFIKLFINRFPRKRHILEFKSLFLRILSCDIKFPNSF